MFGHKKCWVCEKIGHKKDMIKRNKYYGDSEYAHEECYKYAFGLKRCPCRKGFISDEKKHKTKTR